MIYEIVHPDKTVKHYISGTMHLSSADAFTFVDEMKNLISKTAIFVPEMDLGTIDPEQLKSKSYLENNKTWADYITPHRYRKYEKILSKAFNIDIRTIDNLHPFYALQIIATTIHDQSKGEALDSHLYNYALSQNTKIAGLETFENQMTILDSIPYSCGFKSLEIALGNVPLFRQKQNHISKLYRQGDIIRIYRKAYREMGQIRHLMLHERNKAMASKLDQMIITGPSIFSAVGAAHLGGNIGILALLMREGYKIKKYNYLSK